jgi:hypothetical protein
MRRTESDERRHAEQTAQQRRHRQNRLHPAINPEPAGFRQQLAGLRLIVVDLSQRGAQVDRVSCRLTH